ncbi:unnamed protein product [Blepharisma stoltei]|uniref:Uncharacterized protein n=1 Tax=Blepharisma stoltei TaxID=1481888 RepID=A0AAU9IFV8_9CILI|nr:unnamed protein product [Blepharisma stoltei]
MIAIIFSFQKSLQILNLINDFFIKKIIWRGLFKLAIPAKSFFVFKYNDFYKKAASKKIFGLSILIFIFSFLWILD